VQVRLISQWTGGLAYLPASVTTNLGTATPYYQKQVTDLCTYGTAFALLVSTADTLFLLPSRFLIVRVLCQRGTSCCKETIRMSQPTPHLEITQPGMQPSFRKLTTACSLLQTSRMVRPQSVVMCTSHMCHGVPESVLVLGIYRSYWSLCIAGQASTALCKRIYVSILKADCLFRPLPQAERCHSLSAKVLDASHKGHGHHAALMLPLLGSLDVRVYRNDIPYTQVLPLTHRLHTAWVLHPSSLRPVDSPEQDSILGMSWPTRMCSLCMSVSARTHILLSLSWARTGRVCLCTNTYRQRPLCTGRPDGTRAATSHAPRGAQSLHRPPRGVCQQGDWEGKKALIQCTGDGHPEVYLLLDPTVRSTPAVPS
jgi:hypothetical protein